MPKLLFNPDCYSNKRTSQHLYEESICGTLVKSSRRRLGNKITNQQTQDILNNNVKVSADGTVATFTDVDIDNPQIRDVITYSPNGWVNLPWTDFTAITPTQTSNIIANVLKISADGPINTHSDVQTSGNVTGQILMWNGANWVNTTAQFITVQQVNDINNNTTKVTASSTINVHSDFQSDVNTTAQIIMFNGTVWTSASIPVPIN